MAFQQASLFSTDADRTRCLTLRAEIERHNHLYHTLDAPEITDDAYNALFRELKELETRFPELRTADSPTHRVGGAVLEGLETRAHRQRMYSLDNVFSDDEWQAFWIKLQRFESQAKPEFWCDPKMDGLALELIYEHGRFSEALTRGDGESGEVVTAALRTLRKLPLTLCGPGPFPALLEVRGEVIIAREAFAQLNQRQEQAGLKLFANPRNAAAGSIRQLDSSVTASRPLQFLAYGTGEISPDAPAWPTHAELMAALESYGFELPPGGRVCTDLEAVKACRQELEAEREQLAFDIDGMVIKLNDREAQAALGFTARAPRFAVAWKFAPQQVTSRLLQIVIQVGRTGVLTPVAEIEPVNVGGVTVSRATLHNEDEIKARDLREGDTVIVQRAGDVIPELVGPVLAARPAGLPEFVFPHTCPACGEAASRLPNEAAWRCVNVSCPAVRREAMVHFVSKAGLDVQGVGRKWIEQLVDDGVLHSPADLLSLTQEQLLRYERMGEKSAANFVAALDAMRRNASLNRLICALGIRHVGEQTARTLAAHFTDLDELAAAHDSTLQELSDIGPELASSIIAFFDDGANRRLLADLKERGLWPQGGQAAQASGADRAMDGPLAGKSVLFTGSLSMPRGKAQALAERAGAVLASSVTTHLDMLIVGDKPGSKLLKARSLGIVVLDEAAFVALVQGTV